MKKYAPVFFVCIFFAVSSRADADQCIREFTLLSPQPFYYLSFTVELVPAGGNSPEGGDGMLGLGISLPLLEFWYKSYKNKKGEHISSSGQIAPQLDVHYSIVHNWLRIRTGIQLLRFIEEDFFWYDYYVGVSGVFMQNLEDTITTGGISLAVGVSLSYLILFYIRFQTQYDFLTIEKYNRFGITFCFGSLL
ncbi:MAG: hypothetical protein LBG87_05885 [Spirochaetaceae bacterium]|jgi:hypothetical protein|nr:hypothetical protein [Spirochaetaceae bacterium]